MSKLVIATRESPLALWQANHVAGRLRQLHPGVTVELLGMTSRGDQLLDKPLYKVGGKGLFVKELETALLDGRGYCGAFNEGCTHDTTPGPDPGCDM